MATHGICCSHMKVLKVRSGSGPKLRTDVDTVTVNYLAFQTGYCFQCMSLIMNTHTCKCGHAASKVGSSSSGSNSAPLGFDDGGNVRNKFTAYCKKDSSSLSLCRQWQNIHQALFIQKLSTFLSSVFFPFLNQPSLVLLSPTSLLLGPVEVTQLFGRQRVKELLTMVMASG